MIGYDAVLNKKFLENIHGTFSQVSGISWQPGSVFFALTLKNKNKRLNVLKYAQLCHKNCADCDLLPTKTHMNCKTCLTGYTLNNNTMTCEIIKEEKGTLDKLLIFNEKTLKTAGTVNNAV